MPHCNPSFVAALLLGISACTAVADTLEARVLRIESGDVVTVLDSGNRQSKVRLAGIAAPDKLQAFGRRSQANLAALLSAQEVSMTWNGRDREGRLLGRILVAAPGSTCRQQPGCPKTLDAGLQQVTDGMAWWYQPYASALDGATYEHAEFDAKVHRRGLWAETNPIPPWKWPK